MEVADRRVLAALAQDEKVVIFVCMAGVSDPMAEMTTVDDEPPLTPPGGNVGSPLTTPVAPLMTVEPGGNVGSPLTTPVALTPVHLESRSCWNTIWFLAAYAGSARNRRYGGCLKSG